MRDIRHGLLVLVLLAGCKKSSEQAAPVDPNRPKPISASEVKRGNDACQALIEKACACAEKVPEQKEACALAKGYPDALRVALEIAASPESTKRDVLQAQDSMRKTVASCVREVAKLPTLGCP